MKSTHIKVNFLLKQEKNKNKCLLGLIFEINGVYLHS